MKKMTCQAMGGSCDAEIPGETADELMANGKKHVHDQADAGDEGHKALVDKMTALSEEERAEWAEGVKAGFDDLEDA
jgi:hypothetical protein